MVTRKVARAVPAVLHRTKSYARKHDSDLAIPNCRGSGLGNVLVYTRLIEDLARYTGRPLSVITAPLAPKVGVVEGEHPYPFLLHNPFISRIVNAEEVDPDGFKKVNDEERELCQINHIIENICFAYGLRPRELRPSLFLSHEEQLWALEVLKALPRPVICLHPGGTTSSRAGCPWYKKNWLKMVASLKGEASFLQIGRKSSYDQDLGLYHPGRTIREAIALIWASDLFIGYDSSPMHMATALRKPVICVVHMQNKFDWETSLKETYAPSVVLRWLYPDNTNFGIMPEDRDGEHLLARVIDAVRRKLSTLTYQI